MFGKASEIKTSGLLKGIDEVDLWLEEFPEATVLQMLISPVNETDYFYVIYKTD